MTKRRDVSSILLFAIMLMIGSGGVVSVYAQDQKNSTSSASKAKPSPAIDVKGVWSGTFFPKHSNVSPFTLTVVINPDAQGRLVGSSSLNSNCLKDVRLEVTVTGANVVLAGSDDSGNNITVRGTVDSTGTLMKATYILNGSATGKCETDDGTGNLAKR
jgi:hypothetical protein